MRSVQPHREICDSYIDDMATFSEDFPGLIGFSISFKPRSFVLNGDPKIWHDFEPG